MYITIRKIQNGFVIETDKATTIGANSPDKVVLYLAGLLNVPIESLEEDDFYKELINNTKKRGKK